MSFKNIDLSIFGQRFDKSNQLEIWLEFFKPIFNFLSILKIRRFYKCHKAFNANDFLKKCGPWRIVKAQVQCFQFEFCLKLCFCFHDNSPEFSEFFYLNVKKAPILHIVFQTFIWIEHDFTGGYFLLRID